VLDIDLQQAEIKCEEDYCRGEQSGQLGHIQVQEVRLLSESIRMQTGALRHLASSLAREVLKFIADVLVRVGNHDQ
jgi:hypothetical protein